MAHLTQRIKIPRTSDKTIIKCFKNIATDNGITHIRVTGVGFIQFGQLSLVEENEGLNLLLTQNDCLIENCSISVGALSINYYRGGNYPPENKSPIYDEVILTGDQQQLNDIENKTKIQIISKINSTLNPFIEGRAISGTTPHEEQASAIHLSTLERLESLNEELILKSEQFRNNLEQSFLQKRTELELGIEQKRIQLEDEYVIKKQNLDNKEKTINEKIKDIDDRNNTHARRAIRDKMLDDVKSRIQDFGVSQNTENKRKPVLNGIYLMCLVFALLIFYTIIEIQKIENTQVIPTVQTQTDKTSQENSNQPKLNASSNIATSATDLKLETYWLWFKLTILSAGLLGTILFYIKWQNKWAEKHSETEFQLQQFYIDVNRANWIIESCLEWRKETKSAIPSTLIDSITKNLFNNEMAKTENVIHPADELASALMGSASKLKLKLGENELEFDKPAKIKSKTSTNNDE